MKIIPNFFFLLLGCGSLLVQAQQPADLKGEVYSTFLRRIIEQTDSLAHRKSQSVVVIPTAKAERNGARTNSLEALMVPPRNGTAPAPDTSPDGKPALKWLPPPVRPQRSAFGDWVRADTSLVDMGRQFDALEQNKEIVTGPLAVPECVVHLEGPNFFKSAKWQDWNYFYRQNKNSFGVVELSDIAFSADARHAVFYVGIHRGMLNGVGYYAFMERTAQGWSVKYISRLWIS